MSDHKDNDKQYTVDEILAEYGRGSHAKPPKVVPFPERKEQPVQPEALPLQSEEKAPASQEAEPQAALDEQGEAAPPSQRQKSSETDATSEGTGSRAAQPMAEIVPEGVGRHIAARLSTLLRRADHYADHMYDQAEPDEETVKAERYIPGVDREEKPDSPAPAPRRPRTEPSFPDTAPADLARRLQKGLKGRQVRTVLALLAALAAVFLSLGTPGIGVDWSAGSMPAVRLAVLTGLLALTGLLCWEIPLRGVTQLFTLHPGAETLAALAWLFTLGDAAALLTAEYRPGLPCCAITALGLVCCHWGDTLHRRADRLSARTVAPARTPYVVTLDENKWSGRPAYAKWSGSSVGFGSQLQALDGAQRAWSIAAPLLLLLALLCALMSGVHAGDPLRFVWSASACLTAACAWSALLCYALPYHRLARRLHQVGAALAGWPGVARCKSAGILMTDTDLFPPGSVQVAQVRVFGGVSTEKVVAYTATLLRVFPCGLTRPFHDLLRAQGAIYREVSGVRAHEGGLSGIIRNQEILVGTASFMRLMDVGLPQGLNIKNGVFCAIGGQLAGMFPLNYAMSPAVNPSLSALMRSGVSPILATRDFNLIPALLGQKFKLPVDKMEFPPVERRVELSQDDQEHDTAPVALLCREGLGAYSDAVVGGRRLRSATRLSLVFSLLGAVVGVGLTFYLTFAGAWDSLTTANFLVFMAAWLVPELLVTGWVNQY